MIFFTIGTHEPFDRMVRAVDSWAAASGADILGQIPEGTGGSYRPRHFRSVSMLTPDAYAKCVRTADFVVAHAGTGSIISALQHGRPILIMPRRGHLMETRNDHQFATAMRMRNTPGVTVAMDETELPLLLDRLRREATPPGQISRWAEPQLIDAVRRFIHEKA